MVLRADWESRARGEKKGPRSPGALFRVTSSKVESPEPPELPPAQPGGGHRVKNVLATVNAVAAHTMDASSSMEHFVAALDGRIRSMASTHELLSDRRWEGVPLASSPLRELEAYTSTTNTNLEGPEVLLRAEAGQAIALCSTSWSPTPQNMVPLKTQGLGSRCSGSTGGMDHPERFDTALARVRR